MKAECLKLAEQLPDYLEGLCGPDDEARIRSHLETCAECREMADSLRLLDGAMELSPVDERLDPARRAKIVETAETAVAKARTGLLDRILAPFRTNTASAPAGFPWLPAVARLALFILLPLAVTLFVTQWMSRRFASPGLAARNDLSWEFTNVQDGGKLGTGLPEQEAAGSKASADSPQETYHSFFMRAARTDAAQTPPAPPANEPLARWGQGAAAKSDEVAENQHEYRRLAAKKAEETDVNFSLASAAKPGDDGGVVMKGLYEGRTAVSAGSLLADAGRDEVAHDTTVTASGPVAGEPARPAAASSPATPAPQPPQLIAGVTLNWTGATAGKGAASKTESATAPARADGAGAVFFDDVSAPKVVVNGFLTGASDKDFDGDGLAIGGRQKAREEKRAQVANSIERGNVAAAPASGPVSDRFQRDASDRRTIDHGGFAVAGQNDYAGAADTPSAEAVSKQKSNVTGERLGKQLESTRESGLARQDQSRLGLAEANRTAPGQWYAYSGSGAVAGGDVILEALRPASGKTGSGTLTLDSEVQSDLKPASTVDQKTQSEFAARQRIRNLGDANGRGEEEEAENDYSGQPGERAKDLVKLETTLPKPSVVGTPVPLQGAGQVAAGRKMVTANREIHGDADGRAAAFGIQMGETASKERSSMRGGERDRAAGGPAGVSVATPGTLGTEHDLLASANGAGMPSLPATPGGASDGGAFIGMEGAANSPSDGTAEPLAQAGRLLEIEKAGAGLEAKEDAVGTLGRLRKTPIREFDLRSANIRDVAAFIEEAVNKDGSERPIRVELGDESVTSEKINPPQITMSLKNVSAEQALKYTLEVAGLNYRVEGDRIIIRPAGVVCGTVLTRLYPVRPGSPLAGKNADELRAFAEQLGVPFPAGTSISTTGSNDQLVVANTAENLEKLDAVLTALPDAPRPAPPRQPAPFNPYVEAAADAFSTFGIDVDTASYTLTRRALLEQGNWPDPEHVRTEEIVNAFDYDYTPPANGAFSIDAQLAPSPFRAPLDLLKIGIRGRVIGRDAKKPAVLTVVLDTSGSMDTPDRLGRIRTALRLLADRLQPQDTIALVGFNETPRLLLDRVNGTQKKAVLDAIDAISASGSTQLEGGIRLGYEVAARGFVAGGANRVLLLSDGVANLGAATAQQILAAVETQRKQGIYLTVLGFGSGTYDDAMLMQLADKGDGTYAFVDSDAEARRLLVDNWEQTLHVIAKDAKIQVEFNPERVRRWRQLGYEKRQLTREQFRDDTVDAGEVGSGQSVTALYDVDLIRTADIPVREDSTPIATVRVRYKDPDTGRVTELERRITNADRIADFAKAPPRFRVAACAAELAEKLRVSPYAEATELRSVTDTLRPAAMELRLDQRVQELLRLTETAAGLGR